MLPSVLILKKKHVFIAFINLKLNYNDFSGFQNGKKFLEVFKICKCCL